MKTYQNSLAILIAFSFLNPICVSAKDLGIMSGETTPALAMYYAQTKFATGKCVSEGLVDDTKGAAKIDKFFDRMLRRYMKKDEETVANFHVFYTNYTVAWNASGEEVHRAFCDGLSREIAEKRMWWAGGVNYMRSKFSPISKKSARRANTIIGLLSVVPAAASISAAQDAVSSSKHAVSSAKAGEFARSNQQLERSSQLMGVSRNLGQVTTAVANIAAGTPTNVNYNELTSVLEEENADGTRRIVRCPVVDHFYSYPAPVESAVWTTYEKVSMLCRDPVPADLQYMK